MFLKVPVSFFSDAALVESFLIMEEIMIFSPKISLKSELNFLDHLILPTPPNSNRIVFYNFSFRDFGFNYIW